MSKDPQMPTSPAKPDTGDRLAKVIARSGLCSRRDAETWITAGRVVVNGKKVLTPAFNVTDRDTILVDGAPLAARQGTRVWLYHKPAGLVVTEKDPEGRPTIFEALTEHGLPRVVTVGRLDINTEGLLLLTNDGGLKRVLELPATGWLRRYRVRAHGSVTQARLDSLKDGIEVDGVRYGPIEATLEREQGSNVWLVVALREGKNREVKNVLGALGLEVNRLIRVSYGPFQLNDIPVGGIETVRAKVLRDQLGKKLADAADVDFDSEMPELDPNRALVGKPTRDRKTGRGTNTVEINRQRFRFTDHAELSPDEWEAQREQRPVRSPRDRVAPRSTPVRGRGRDDGRPAGPPRRIHFDEDGRAPEEYQGKPAGRGGRDRDDAPGRGFGKPRGDGPARPRRDAGDAPRGGYKPRRDAEGGPARPRRDAGDAPRAGYKPRRDAEGGAGRPRRDAGDAPRGAYKPRRDAEGADARPARGGRPPRREGAAPARGARPPRTREEAAARGADKPFGPRGDKPFRPREEGGAAGQGRPARSRPEGDRGGKPARFAGKPGARPPRDGGAGRPSGARPPAGRPSGARPSGARPTGGRPTGGRPSGSRPAGGKPSGGPRRPRG